MPDIKEKPKMGKPKAKNRAATLPKQTARIMKEKYIRELKSQPKQAESENSAAAEQVEGAGRWAADELSSHTPVPSGRQRQKQGREKARQETRKKEKQPAASRETVRAESGPTQERTVNPPKERGMLEDVRIGAGDTTSVADGGEAPAVGPKERPEQFRARQWAKDKLAQERTQQPTGTPAPEARGPSAQGRTEQALGGVARDKHNSPAASRRTASTSPHAARHPGRNDPGRGRGHRPGTIKERTRTGPALRTRSTASKGPKTGPVKPKAGKQAVRQTGKLAAKKTAQTARRQMARQAAVKATQAAKATAAMVKRVAVAAVKAVASLVSAVAGIAGGAVVLIALVIVIVIAAIVNSPFGLFFAGEQNGPDAVSVSQAVAQVNVDLNSRLENLQSGEYDTITIQGQPPAWSDVLAVFAAKTAGAETGVDVATLDPERRALLSAVFWDMTAITTSSEEVEHPASGDTPAWTEKKLTITITAKTADDMRTAYTFTEYQNSALDELLADRAALTSLAGDLSITDMDAKTLLAALPADLDPEREAVVETACQLVGKVNYFWGGKSLVIGWDSRWGQLQKVWAEGSSTTGTYRPYGLDCSGFVDWVFYNMTGGEYIIGHGGGARMQHTYCTDITWDEALPGDLVFYPDDEHVGVVGGRDADGNLLVIHCASSANNVVITGADGFIAVARPLYYDE